MKTPFTQPLVLMGMHRSGTTLLTRCLAELGLFIGWKRQRNEEALLFRRYNDHLFTLAGARWDQPTPARTLGEEGGPAELLGARLREATRSYQSLSFLGPRRYLQSRGLDRLREPWGWKDPRNTFLLDLWLRVFPGAKVVNMVRHGVDVAASLRVRHRARFQPYHASSLTSKAILNSPPNPAASLRCATLQGGFTLWQEYLAQGRDAVERWGLEERFLELRFEELVRYPESSLARVATFAGLDASTGSVQRAAALVSSEKANRWENDQDLRSFARECGAALEAEGFGE